MSTTPILHGLRGKLDAATLTPHCGALVTAMILLSLAGFLAVGISRDLDFLGSNINQSVAVQSLLQVGCVLACLPVISVAWRCASALEHFLPDLWTSLLGCSAFFDRSFRLSATRGRHRGVIAAAFRNAILLLLLLQPAVAAPKKSARRPQAPSVAGAASPVAASAPSAASLPSSPATPSTPPQPFQATAVVPLPSPPPPAVLPSPATAASAVHLAQQAAFLALARPLPPRPLPSAAPRRGPATTASAAAASAPAPPSQPSPLAPQPEPPAHPSPLRPPSRSAPLRDTPRDGPAATAAVPAAASGPAPPSQPSPLAPQLEPPAHPSPLRPPSRSAPPCVAPRNGPAANAAVPAAAAGPAPPSLPPPSTPPPPPRRLADPVQVALGAVSVKMDVRGPSAAAAAARGPRSGLIPRTSTAGRSSRSRPRDTAPFFKNPPSVYHPGALKSTHPAAAAELVVSPTASSAASNRSTPVLPLPSAAAPSRFAPPPAVPRDGPAANAAVPAAASGPAPPSPLPPSTLPPPPRRLADPVQVALGAVSVKMDVRGPSAAAAAARGPRSGLTPRTSTAGRSSRSRPRDTAPFFKNPPSVYHPGALKSTHPAAAAELVASPSASSASATSNRSTPVPPLPSALAPTAVAARAFTTPAAYQPPLAASAPLYIPIAPSSDASASAATFRAPVAESRTAESDAAGCAAAVDEAAARLFPAPPPRPSRLRLRFLGCRRPTIAPPCRTQRSLQTRAVGHLPSGHASRWRAGSCCSRTCREAAAPARRADRSGNDGEDSDGGESYGSDY